MSEGNIVTFYSYKGGVGRTFVLANIGALLSLWGYKTLCIDWDLEAPGLHLFFKQWFKEENLPGLTEMIQAYAEGKEPRWQDFVTEVNFSDSPQPLRLMKAGLQDKTYVQRMQALDWDTLYSGHDLGNFLEKLRENWKQFFDFVLIDSRTGITDIGGICTIQLPDILMLLLTANDQSLNGSLEVLERIQETRTRFPFDRAKLLVAPVVSRFERRVEYDLADQWLGRFADLFPSIYNDWVYKDTTAMNLLNYIRIPYIPYWSFGEKLPVIERGTSDPEDIGYPLETLAALVAQKLTSTDILIQNRDTFVAIAKRDIYKVVRELPTELTQDQDQTIIPAGTGLSSDATQARQEMRYLIRQYRDMRFFMPTSPERTRNMESVRKSMQEQAQRARYTPEEITSFLLSFDEGERLVGLATLYWLKDVDLRNVDYFEQVLKLMNEPRSRYEHYHTLEILKLMKPHLSDQQQVKLREVVGNHTYDRNADSEKWPAFCREILGEDRNECG